MCKQIWGRVGRKGILILLPHPSSAAAMKILPWSVVNNHWALVRDSECFMFSWQPLIAKYQGLLVAVHFSWGAPSTCISISYDLVSIISVIGKEKVPMTMRYFGTLSRWKKFLNWVLKQLFLFIVCVLLTPHFPPAPPPRLFLNTVFWFSFAGSYDESHTTFLQTFHLVQAQMKQAMFNTATQEHYHIHPPSQWKGSDQYWLFHRNFSKCKEKTGSNAIW